MATVRRVKTETIVRASAERVWTALTDFASFPDWNPFIVEAHGDLIPGERLHIRLDLGSRKPMTLRPRVTAVEAHRELRWRATLGAPGLFDVDRAFLIEPDDAGVRFVMSEDCTGWLTRPIFAAGLETRLYGGYDALNRALQRRVEDSG